MLVVLVHLVLVSYVPSVPTEVTAPAAATCPYCPSRPVTMPLTLAIHSSLALTSCPFAHRPVFVALWRHQVRLAWHLGLVNFGCGCKNDAAYLVDLANTFGPFGACPSSSSTSSGRDRPCRACSFGPFAAVASRAVVAASIVASPIHGLINTFRVRFRYNRVENKAKNK